MISHEASISLAEQVVSVLRRRGIDAIVIGGVALLAHNYLRSTEDLDLGVNATRAELRLIRDDLLKQGYTVEFREPDGGDSLGGVLDVEDVYGGIVQIVNFDNAPANGFPRVIRDALQALGPSTGGLRVAPLAHVVAMKLYAGGKKSLYDIKALIENNPDEDWAAIRALCESYRLSTNGLF